MSDAKLYAHTDLAFPIILCESALVLNLVQF